MPRKPRSVHEWMAVVLACIWGIQIGVMFTTPFDWWQLGCCSFYQAMTFLELWKEEGRLIRVQLGSLYDERLAALTAQRDALIRCRDRAYATLDDHPFMYKN